MTPGFTAQVRRAFRFVDRPLLLLCIRITFDTRILTFLLLLFVSTGKLTGGCPNAVMRFAESGEGTWQTFNVFFVDHCVSLIVIAANDHSLLRTLKVPLAPTLDCQPLLLACSSPSRTSIVQGRSRMRTCGLWLPTLPLK